MKTKYSIPKLMGYSFKHIICKSLYEKKEKNQISNSSFHLEKLGKEEQTKTKASRRK